MTDSKQESVVFIPSYIASGIEASGVKLVDLAIIASGLTPKWNGPNNMDITNELTAILTKHMSVYDIATMVACTYELTKLIVGADIYPKSGLGLYLSRDLADNHYLTGTSDEKYKELYFDLLNDLRSSSNNMSEIKNNGFELVSAADTIFVILHEGFSNFIIDGNRDNREKFLLELVNRMFSSFGEESVQQHKIFRQYLGSTRNQ